GPRTPPLRAVVGDSASGARELRVGAWAALCGEEPVFREAVERCADAAGAPGTALRRALADGGPDASAPDVEPGLLDFAVAWGLVAQLRSWGIVFQEAVASSMPACLAGTLDVSSVLSPVGSSVGESSPKA